MGIASPSVLFQQLLEQIQQQCADISQNLEGEPVQRKWMMPAAIGNWKGNPLDIASIADAFDRSEANEQYQDAIFKNGTSGTAMGQKVQIDYLGMMERAFRSRHKTPCRAAMHAAGRRKGHGQPEGVHSGAVLLYVQDLLRSGLRDESNESGADIK